MSRAIVIYFSLEGNCKFIAEVMSEALGADLLRLETVKKLNPKSFSKFFWGGMQASLGKKPELEKYLFESEKYDTIILGAPVWASQFAPAFNTFLDKNNLRDKQLALFCCHAGGMGKTLTKMEQKLNADGKKEIPCIDFIEPLKRDKAVCQNKALDWIKNNFE